MVRKRSSREFRLAALGLALTECVTLAAIPVGIPGLWEQSPHPLLAFLLLFVLAVLIPGMLLYMLWLSSRSVVSFLLQAVAASTVLFGILMAGGATVGLLLRAPEPTHILLAGYIPLAITLICLSIDDTLNRPQPATL